MYFEDGSFGFLDMEEHRWWSYDTATVVRTKIEKILGGTSLEVGGVFAWGLGEDAPGWERLRATMEGVDEIEGKKRDEL
jgi:hypothetical protein